MTTRLTDTLAQNMRPPKAVLLAAGLGTRLQPLTHHITKCMVPIAGRPLLDYWITALCQTGVQEVLINTHHLADQVRAYIQRIHAQGTIHLQETYEPQLLGSAGTLAANPHFADETDEIIIIYADNLSTVDLSALLNFHRQHTDPATLLLFHAPNPRACGIAQLDEDQRIIHFEEKPAQPIGDLANAGVYVLDANLYREIAALQAFDFGFEILPKLVGRMRGWTTENSYHRDMGTYVAYLQAQRDVVDWRQAQGHYQGKTPAIFLDRDGTVIEQVHYLSHPEQVRLLPGAGTAIRQLRAAGFACIVVSNQSPIGKGLITEAELQEIHHVLCEQLAAEGTQLDGFYYSPEETKIKDRTVVEFYDRKPGPGLLFKAAEELHLDLTRSWMIGDMISDILAGYHAHCQGLILVETGKGLEEFTVPETVNWLVSPDLLTASNLILQHTDPKREQL